MTPDKPEPSSDPFWILVNNTDFKDFKVSLLATNVSGGCFTMTVTLAPGSSPTTETAFHPGLYHVGGRIFEDMKSHCIRAGAAAMESKLDKEMVDPSVDEVIDGSPD